MTKGSSYTGLLVASVAIAGAYIFFDNGSTLNKFGEAFTERLCDLLPHHKEMQQQEKKPAQEEEVVVPNPPKQVLSRESIFNPKVTGGRSYNAKEALDARYQALKSVCHHYTDYMRPEKLLADYVPEGGNFWYNAASENVFCGTFGNAYKSFKALFDRMISVNDGEMSKYQTFKSLFPRTMKGKRRAIFVRHPMERLLSIFRKEFAASFTPSGEKTEDEISFADFITLVVNGPAELAEFVSVNALEGQSLGLDTGMVDGKGRSKKWLPYWRQCGLCHPDFMPHYILHNEHYMKDEEVYIEMLGDHPEAKMWLQVPHDPVASQEEVLEHFYSQLTKAEIRKIYEKYRVDFELFGYTPDYFLQFGTGA